MTWHLEIAERIANELLDQHPEADLEMVEVMVWLHDYGKLINFADQYQTTLSAGRQKLLELGFKTQFVEQALLNVETIDKKLEVDLTKANIEVQIVSSADGCSHLVGPFMAVWWLENSDRSLNQLMDDNRQKLDKDWNYKIVIPEARQAFQNYYETALQQSGELPAKFLQ